MSAWTHLNGKVRLSPESKVNIKNVLSTLFAAEDAMIVTEAIKQRNGDIEVIVVISVDVDATEATTRIAKALERCKITMDARLKADLRVSGRLIV